MSQFFYYFLFLSCVSLVVNGDYVFGFNDYTRFQAGNINVMLSAPHDGPLTPDEIPDRTYDKLGNLATDRRTSLIAEGVRDELKKLFSAQGVQNADPFLVINNLHRKKMDPNRNPIESCEKANDLCSKAYNDYHNFISKNFADDFMINGDGAKYKQALLIDIHGQGHSENWTEVGYLLTSSQFDAPILPALASKKSSIGLLASQSSYSFDELIRGDVSIGGLLQKKFNLKVVPSPKFRAPGEANYYNGGFITLNYGANGGYKQRLNAVQIELHSSLRGEDNYKSTAIILANVIFDYYNIHNFSKLN